MLHSPVDHVTIKAERALFSRAQCAAIRAGVDADLARRIGRLAVAEFRDCQKGTLQ